MFIFKDYQLEGGLLARMNLDPVEHLHHNSKFKRFNINKSVPCFNRRIMNQYKDKIKKIGATTKNGYRYLVDAETFWANAKEPLNTTEPQLRLSRKYWKVITLEEAKLKRKLL